MPIIKDFSSINLADLGAKADGATYDTQAFVKASQDASGRPILLSPGTYRLNKTSDLNLPSLRCIVGYATIVVEDAFAFLISSNFTMSHVKIVSKNTYTKTDTNFKPLIKATSTIDNVTLENVVFDSVLSASDGTVRASVAVSLGAVTNLKLRDITVNGYRYGIQTNGLSNGINGNNLNFYNVELPLYMRGSDPQVQDSNYAKNIEFSQVTHINTQVQSQNYFKQAGSDTFLFEKCDTVTINDVIAEYPVERTAYFSACKNAVVSDWNLKNAIGIKFVGASNTAIPVEIIANNCKVSNVHITVDDATLTQQVHVAEFYWAKDLSVKGCTLNGSSIASVIVSTRHYVENLTIEENYGDNLKRGMFEYQYVGAIDNPDPTPDIAAGNYTAGVKGLTIRKNTVKNSNTLDYDVIKLSDAAPPSAGTYRYQDLIIEDNTIINPVDDNGIQASGNFCKGLINIDSVSGLRMKGNKIVGHKRTDVNGNTISLPIQVGSNSKNVFIQHEETTRNQDHKYNFGTLYLSADSEIKITNINKLISYLDVAVITPKHDATGVSITKDIKNNFRIKGRMYVSDTTDFALPLIGTSNASYPLPAIFGMVDIIGDAGDVGGYTITKAGAVAIKSGSSALFVASTTTGKFAFFKDSSPRYTLRYSTGTQTSFIIDYSLGV